MKKRWRRFGVLLLLCTIVTTSVQAAPTLQQQKDDATKENIIIKDESLIWNYPIRSLLEENTSITVRPNIRIQKYLEDYLIELTNELKRLERFEENSDILDNITYIVELVSKMTPM